MYSFALKIKIFKHVFLLKFQVFLDDAFRNIKLNTLTNNIYIRRSGRFLVIAALLSIVLFIFGIIDLLWSTSFASFIGNIYVNILRNLINYSLLLCAIVAFIYAGEVDIQQIYKISLIYIASFSWLTIWILINVHVDTYNETLYSMLSWISIAINGLLDFMLITAWWKLLSTAQPIVDHGDEPISRLFLNRGVVGFVATLIIMTAMLFLLANILIC